MTQMTLNRRSDSPNAICISANQPLAECVTLAKCICDSADLK